ncbi:MAG TPA: low molecular weight protein-tyrosine-phosphatase [Dyella sp.]|uniref:low molecular weight protein-tyrosine-phosphatase n=1 Tax=Dyella sp. TaxID=1869338 RepID=UPI002D01E183|nr:low molecular weight protein-tyrosine-phosphatase [Dyella sp.]HTV84020.1 low molecular weight protein-tyrosine-phosphatase [Dyella sp.]
MIERILFVCLGNICRSPLVEAVARQRFAEAALDIEVASCGTGGWHVGAGADGRMQEAAAAAGYRLDDHRGRQLSVADFAHYDLLLAMDCANLRDMRRLAPHAIERTALFLDWAGVAPMLEFPDPYFGGQASFVASVKLAEQGVAALIERLRAG